MVWARGLNPIVWVQSDVFIAPYNRWLPATFDMANVPLEGGGNGWSGQGAVTSDPILRFDPLEQDDSGPLPDFFRIGGAHLMSQPLSDQRTLVRWAPLQGDGQVDIYRDNDNQGYNGTLVAANVPLSQGSYGWDTSALSAGTYWVYLVLHSTLFNPGDRQYSLAPVVVSHASGSNSTIFVDVPTNNPFASWINDLATQNLSSGTGIINGYQQADTTLLFKPGNTTNRGQVCKIVVLAAGWTLVSPPNPTFSDVPANSPYYTFVETAVAHNVVSGYADGTFRPFNNVTRGQTAKMIVLSRGWTVITPPTPHFIDVSQSNPFYGFIETAYSHGIINGYSDGTFRPGNSVTRGQLAKMVSLARGQP